MLRGIKPVPLSHEHYTNKQRISGGKINELQKLPEIWMKLHHGRKYYFTQEPNKILKDDQEIKLPVELIKKEVVHRSDIWCYLTQKRHQKYIKINKTNDEIRQNSDGYTYI